jgi:hypothetical protein
MPYRILPVSSALSRQWVFRRTRRSLTPPGTRARCGAGPFGFGASGRTWEGHGAGRTGTATLSGGPGGPGCPGCLRLPGGHSATRRDAKGQVISHFICRDRAQRTVSTTGRVARTAPLDPLAKAILLASQALSLVDLVPNPRPTVHPIAVLIVPTSTPVTICIAHIPGVVMATLIMCARGGHVNSHGERLQ